MTSKLLLFHTLRYLRWEQIVFRIAARFRKVDATPVAAPPVTAWSHPWTGTRYKAATLAADDTWTFLGESHRVERASDWNHTAWSKLWLYNLHYFDDLDAVDAETRAAQHEHWVTRWVTDNPASSGNGWEPYTLSLRIVNWIKWLSTHPDPQPGWLDSLALQVSVLQQRLEYHLLGNHLFANAKALVFAGTYFSGDLAKSWVEKGVAIFDREIPEQFLADGAHFELSPMYHATLLWDLIELLELARCSGHGALKSREPVWREYVARGLAWLATMCHADGEISFFNDAAFGIAPSPEQVYGYAARLGFAPPAVARPAGDYVRLTRMESSGYARIDWPDAEAFIDVARVGPDYLPGHAHADTLSFEWSLRAQRVLVNSGTSQYGDDAERQRQRGTAAHNTVVIGGENSSEVWAGFRVARRAYPTRLTFANTVSEVRLGCAHTGYRRLAGRPVHRREWLAVPHALRITDTLSEPSGDAVAYFHLHPDVRATLVAGTVQLELMDGGTVSFRFEGGAPTLSASTWHPRFGESVPSTRIVVPFQAATLVTVMNWSSDIP
ncbi:heparinase II/III family protein [Paraburkholderia sp. GAS42]|uniref:heparinase II/III family protein n=1 Tax=Paraburkholderia sp. GAS42 TaxID=3035135 RepID=UPI003D19B079